MNAPSARPPLPALRRRQVRRVDQIAIDELGYPGVVLMENAGRGAAEALDARARRLRAASFALLAGPGNNGGDAFVIARHLAHRGWSVRLALSGPRSKLRGDAAINAEIAHRLGFRLPELHESTSREAFFSSLDENTIVVDGLLGTGFEGEVRPAMAELIHRIDAAPRRELVALDIPSGLDCDTGLPTNATLRADHTLSFAAPKIGFSQPGAAAYTGEVEVIGIGVPDSLIHRVAVEDQQVG